MAIVFDISAERGRKRGGLRAGFFSESETGGHRYKTPNESAADRLLAALGEYPSLSDQLKYSWRSEMLQLPNLRILNMETLAATLVLLDLIGKPDVTPDDFHRYLPRAITPFVAKTKDPEKIQKHREDIFRYLRLVKSYREEEEEQLRERVEQRQQEQQAAEDEESDEFDEFDEDEDLVPRRRIEEIVGIPDLDDDDEDIGAPVDVIE